MACTICIGTHYLYLQAQVIESSREWDIQSLITLHNSTPSQQQLWNYHKDFRVVDVIPPPHNCSHYNILLRNFDQWIQKAWN